MKALFIALSTLLFAHAGGHIEAFATQHHYETSYKVALDKAKKENKPLLMLMVTHYCPWCVKFEKKTLSHKEVDTLLSDKYVKLILNREKQEFPKKFDTPRIPTTYLINPKDESITKTILGYKKREDFVSIIKAP